MARRIIVADPSFGVRLRELRLRQGIAYRDFGTISRSYVWELETGRKRPTPETAAALDKALNAGGTLAALVNVEAAKPPARVDATDDELEALELARRAAASDVGEETITRLERIVDDLATSYSVTPPADLLHRTRRYLSYVSNLMESTTRKTLGEHRRLVVVSGWLSLLAATLHIDLKQHAAARARLATAASLARHAGHAEIHAWTFETRAWSALTDGEYRTAIELSQAAQRLAPPGSSVQIQATAQEGRAWARLRRADETYEALARVAQLVSGLARPDRPEHYRYDPDKSVAYVATTLAWLGDPAAERYAREVIARLKAAEDAGGWPRRVAAAQIDLGLALVAAGKPDEAAATAQTAILSGRIVPSNHWRALEVVTAVEQCGLPEAGERGRRTRRSAMEVSHHRLLRRSIRPRPRPQTVSGRGRGQQPPPGRVEQREGYWPSA
jgi:transcriptional regulator with XRE-family HTH domain